MALLDDNEFMGDSSPPEQRGISDEAFFGQGESAPSSQAQSGVSDEDFFGNAPGGSAPPEREQPAPGEEYSPAGSAAMGFAHGAAPAVGGIQAGLAAGAAVTPVATALAAPLGPAAPIVGLGAGLVAGLGAGLGVGKIIEMGEDKFLALLGFDKDFENARKSNPDTYDIAGMVPAAASLKGAGTLAARGIGAGIGAGAELGMQAMGDEPFNWKKVAASTALGGALPNPNKFGQSAIDAGERLGSKVLQSGYVGARYRGGNTNPDLKPVEAEEGTTPHEPAPQEDDITVANDQPQVAGGTALEQPPAPEIPGVGNPGQAAGSQAEASRPSEPARNYAKDQPTTHPEVTESKVLDSTGQGDDIATALGDPHSDAPGEASPPGGTDVLPREASPTIQPEVDNHTPGLRERTQIPESLDITDASRAQREALENIKQKIAAQQKGEAFQGLEHEPLTPEQAKILHQDRAILVNHGLTKGLEALNMLHPREQYTLLRGLGTGKEVLEAKGTPAAKMTQRPDGRERVENRVALDSGATARDHADGARKQGDLNKYREVFDQFGPRSEHGKGFDASDVTNTRAAKAFTKPTWDKVVEAFGKDPFGKGSKAYLPRMRDEKTNEAIEWLRTLRKSALRNEHAGFMTAHEAGKKAVGGMADLDAQTAKIENDRSGISASDIPQDMLDAKAIEARKGEGTGRADIEPYTDPKGNEAPLVAKQHQELRDWVNGLDEDAYNALNAKHDGLVEQTVRTTQDPAEVLRNLQDDLQEASPGAEVRLKPKRLKLPTLKPETKDTITLKGKDGKDLTVERAPAADAGKVYDKNSEEFKRLAAQYGDQKVPDRKGRLESELAAVKRKDDRVDPTSPKAERQAIDGTQEGPLLAKAHEFLGDEQGGVKIPEALKKMFSNPADHTTPAASDGSIQYAKDLGSGFHQLGAKIKNLKVEIMGALARAADTGLTAAERREVALADQNNRTGALQGKLKDYYVDHVVPVRERALEIMRKMEELNKEQGLGIPLDDIHSVTTKAYQPRFRLDEKTFGGKDTDRFDPFSGKGLGDFAANLERRQFYALENGPERLVAEVSAAKDTGGNGGPPMLEVKIHRGKGQVITLKDLPASFEGKLGDTLMLHVKGKKGKWVLDQATTDEITKNTGGAVKYVEEPVWAWSKMLDNVTQAYEHAKLAAAIKNDPKFEALTTTDPKVAKERGYSTVTTHLPQFAKTANGRPIYMADQVRWALDDFHKPGFGGLTDEGIEGLRNFNTAMLKVFNTNAPLVHVLNELDLFTIGRGWKWISPTANYNLAKHAITAFKSVNAQDALQAEMRRAGGNPMLASVAMRAMYENAAKKMGTEIIKEHSKWDPIAKAWGVSTKELGQKVYDASSDVTWRLSDYLYTMRYLEEKQGGAFGAKPKSPEEAMRVTNKFMSDYHLATTVMGSRKLAQFLAEPAVTAFGRYKAGIFRTLGHMTRDLASPNATKQERIDALGQFLVMGAMLYVAYPAMDAVVQKVTGNEGGELRRRGVSSVVDAVKNIATGEKDPMVAGTRAWTPAPALTMAKELVTNRSFGDKPIIPQGKWPGVLPDAVGGLAEYGARTVVPPYGAASQHFSRKEGSMGSAAGALLADQVGVSLPSDAGDKYQQQYEKHNAQAEKARLKRPNGMIPAAVNRVFKD